MAARAHPAQFVLPGAQSPRSAPALARRLQWERRAHRALASTDVAVTATATACVAVAGWQQDVAAMAPALDEQALAAPGLVTVVWLGALAGIHSRDPSILCSGATEYRRVVHASGLAFALLAAIALIADWPELRVQLLLALPVGVLALLVARWRWRRWLLERRRQGEWASRTIVAGPRDDIAYVLERLSQARDMTFHVVAVALVGDPGAPLELRGRTVPVLDPRSTLSESAARMGADTVIIASAADADPARLTRLSRELEGTCAELVLFSRLTDVAGPRISFRPLDGLPLMQVRIPTFDGAQHTMKRALDIAVAASALVVVALLAVPIAIAIKLDDPGPVLFRQQRIGRDGRSFDMLKFRTMRVDAEERLAELQAHNEADGPLFKLRADPRVTRTGRFLRKHSLDELPQFWNALKGDMSVVGPRPPLPAEATAYDGASVRRLYLKPGITGLWQISGRSDLSWEESVRLDLRYVENWSVMQDLMIILRTARHVVRPSGAY